MLTVRIGMGGETITKPFAFVGLIGNRRFCAVGGSRGRWGGPLGDLMSAPQREMTIDLLQVSFVYLNMMARIVVRGLL